MINKIYILAIIFLLAYNEATPQLMRSQIVDRHVTKKGDTILIQRSPGDWWYGPIVGLTYSKYYGDYIFPTEIIPGWNEYSDLIKYKTGSYFPGIFIGIIGEYNPSHSEYAYGMKITFFDYTKNKLIQKVGDTLRTEYINETKYNYINLSPYFKYSFFRLTNKNFRGLYAFSSLNLEIPVGASANHTKAFYNPVRIDETNSYNFREQLFRYGFQLGLGWDLFDANVEKVARTILSPFISVNFGTKILSDFGSTMSAINFKAGVSLKIGIDKKKYDTLKFIPQEKIVLNVPDIEPSVLDAQEIILTKIDANEIDPIFIEPENRIAPALEPSSQSGLGNENISFKRKIELDRKYIINYPKSEKEVELTNSGKDFLKEVAEYLNMNPGLVVLIEGYNDDKGGSAKENQRLSLMRAENAKKELLNRGISSEKILVSGKGAVNLITSNSTPEGRARNRRIEIIIKKEF